MKKIKRITFICLLIFGIIACANNKSSNSSGGNNEEIISSNETRILTFEAEIGKEATNTITFTNPYNVEADLTADFSLLPSSIVIDYNGSTCGHTVTATARKTLQAGESCNIKYTYKPTKFETERLRIYVDYRGAFEAICPTPDTVPTYEQVVNNFRSVDYEIYNYAKNSSGKKSPDYIKVNMKAEYEYDGVGRMTQYVGLEPKTFTLPAEPGEYYYNNDAAAVLTSNNDNCILSNNTLSVKNNNGCSLKINKPVYNIISFEPRTANNPYYNVAIVDDSDYLYDITETFSLSFVASNVTETIFDVGILENGASITNYKIEGTGAAKFKVVGTKHNSCNIDDIKKTIKIPTNQNNCFYTVEIADTSEAGEFIATLTTTLNTGSSDTYNIYGDINPLQRICKQRDKYFE